MHRNITMADGQALYRLMTWLSPTFPVGAYSYSHGLEYAVEAGLVADCEQLTDWVKSIIVSGSGRTDGLLLAAAFRAAEERDIEALLEVAQVANACRGTAELALETAAQGKAFMDAAGAAWMTPHLRELTARLAEGHGAVAYPVGVGCMAASQGVPLRATLYAFLQAMAANIVSAGVRLIPLGQSAGVRANAELESAVLQSAAGAAKGTLDDIGTATPMVDWASACHETQYVRLFRS